MYLQQKFFETKFSGPSILTSTPLDTSFPGGKFYIIHMLIKSKCSSSRTLDSCFVLFRRQTFRWVLILQCIYWLGTGTGTGTETRE